ncbi:hypothetical protein [Polaromonas jejuensis]|uniref:Uncharacterized protein n=1 Tax=Polaromonas jejuensis TaxID=457502 RepID=A0ABW0QI85_9BURK|nr:hypothetical protein [Polaromonas jejuensis]
MRKHTSHKEPGLEITEVFDVDPSWYGFAPPAGTADASPANPDDPDSLAGSGE